MVIDRLAASGVAVDGPSAETLARINAAGIEVAPGRLVDLTTAGTRYDVMKGALDVLLAAPEFDLVLAVVGSSARFHPELAVQPIIDFVGAAKPIAAFLVPEAPQALARARRRGRAELPHAGSLRRRHRRRRYGGVRPSRWPSAIVRHGAAAACSTRPEAYALLDRLGIPRAPTVVLDTAVTSAPALPFPYPVAVKVLSAAIAHKTDVGGVALDVADGDALLAAIRTDPARASRARRHRSIASSCSRWSPASAKS